MLKNHYLFKVILTQNVRYLNDLRTRRTFKNLDTFVNGETQRPGLSEWMGQCFVIIV